MKRTIALCCVSALAVAGLVPAYGAVSHLITGKDVKNHSLTGADLKKGSLPLSALNRSTQSKINKIGGGSTAASQGEHGQNGENGRDGRDGSNGRDGNLAFSDAKWGVIGKDTYGSPDVDYRVGPWNSDGSSPPYGSGSLWMAVGGPQSQTPNTDAEKVHFGNEFDFRGDAFGTLNTLSYWVFADEDSLAGHDAPNFEVEVTGAPVGTASGYTTLTALPTVTQERTWFKENVSDSNNRWYSSRPFTGPHAGQCTQAAPCDFATMKSIVSSASILSIGIGKGRDNPFTGAVDGLRVNGTVFDFEPGGTFSRNP